MRWNIAIKMIDPTHPSSSSSDSEIEVEAEAEATYDSEYEDDDVIENHKEDAQPCSTSISGSQSHHHRPFSNKGIYLIHCNLEFIRFFSLDHVISPL